MKGGCFAIKAIKKFKKYFHKFIFWIRAASIFGRRNCARRNSIEEIRQRAERYHAEWYTTGEKKAVLCVFQIKILIFICLSYNEQEKPNQKAYPRSRTKNAATARVQPAFDCAYAERWAHTGDMSGTRAWALYSKTVTFSDTNASLDQACH